MDSQIQISSRPISRQISNDFSEVIYSQDIYDDSNDNNDDADGKIHTRYTSKLDSIRLEAINRVANSDHSLTTSDTKNTFQTDSLAEQNRDNAEQSNSGSKIDRTLYFGEKAKIAFFSKFRQLSAGVVTSTIIKQSSADQNYFPNNSNASQKDRNKDSRDSEKRWDKSTRPKEVKKTGTGVGEGQLSGDMSPRTKFLQMYMQVSMNPPLPIVIRLDPLSEEINLANMGLKDDYIVILAEVLNDLPGVKSLNLRNNKLTDRSMEGLVNTIAVQTSITALDLSENKVDDLTAQALYSLGKRNIFIYMHNISVYFMTAINCFF